VAPTSSEANPPTGGGAGPGAVPRCDGHARRRHWSVDHFAIGNGPASRLATNLRELGEYQQARALDQDTLARRRRVLGDDHPDTRIAAHNLAGDLRLLGEPKET